MFARFVDKALFSTIQSRAAETTGVCSETVSSLYQLQGAFTTRRAGAGTGCHLSVQSRAAEAPSVNAAASC